MSRFVVRVAMAVVVAANCRPFAQAQNPRILPHPAVHTASIEAVAFSPAGDRIASFDRAGVLRAWDVASLQQLGMAVGYVRGIDVAFSPDGSRLAVASASLQAAVLTADKLSRVAKLGRSSLGTSVTAAAWSADGGRLAVGRSTGAIEVCTVQKGGEKGGESTLLEGFQDEVTAVQFLGNGHLAGASRDRTIRVWNLADRLQARRIDVGTTPLHLAISADGSRAAVALAQGGVRVYALPEWNSVKTLEAPGQPLRVAFSPDGQRLAAACEIRNSPSAAPAGLLRVWEVESGKLAALAEHPRGVRCAAYSPDGKTIACGTADASVLLVNAASGRVERTIAGKPDPAPTNSPPPVFAPAAQPPRRDLPARAVDGLVQQIAFSASGKCVAAVAAERKPEAPWPQTIYVWPTDRDQLRAKLPQRVQQQAHCLAFSSDEKLLAVGMASGDVDVFDLDAGQRIHELFSREAQIEHVSFVDKNQAVRCVMQTGDVIDLALADGTILREKSATLLPSEGETPPGEAENLLAAVPWQAWSISADGRWAIDHRGDRSRLHDLTGRQPTHKLPDVAFLSEGLFDRQGNFFYATQGNGQVRQYRVETGELTWQFQPDATGVGLQYFNGHRVPGLALSGDGGSLAVLSTSGRIEVLDAVRGLQQAVFSALDEVHAHALSPGGDTLVVAARFKFSSQADELRFYDVAKAAQSQRFVGHTAHISAIDISPDGALTATGSWDRTIRVWDTASGRPVALAATLCAPVTKVRFSADGRWVAGMGPVQPQRPSREGNFALWEPAGGRTAAWPTAQTAVVDFALSPDGDQAALTDGAVVRVHTTVDGALVRELPAATGVRALAWQGLRLAAAGDDGQVRLWDTRDWTAAETWPAHGAAVTQLEFSPDGRHLASAGADNEIKVWDAATHKAVQVWEDAKTASPYLRFSHDAKWLMVFDGVGVAWDWEGNQRFLPRPPQRIIASVHKSDGPAVMTPDGTAVLMGRGEVVESFDARPETRRWAPVASRPSAAPTASSLAPLKGHVAQVSQVIFTAGGQRLASLDAEGTLKVWNPAEPTAPHSRTAAEGKIHELAASADGAVLAALVKRVVPTQENEPEFEASLEFCDPLTGQPLRTVAGETCGTATLAVSPDGAQTALALGRPDVNHERRSSKLWLIDSQSGQRLHEVTDLAPDVRYAAYSPDGKRLLVAACDWKEERGLTIVDAVAGQVIARLAMFPLAIGSNYSRPAFSPDGTLVALLGTRASEGYRQSHRVALCQIDERTELLSEELRAINKPLLFLISPDGKTLATADKSEMVSFWDLETGKLTRRLKMRSYLERAQFSPDGGKLLTGDRSPTAYDVESGAEYTVPGLNAVSISTWACFSPDGQRVAFGSGTHVYVLPLEAFKPKPGKRR